MASETRQATGPKHDVTPRAAGLAVGLGVALALAAAVLLWSSEGAAIFLGQAFAALAACF